MEFSLINAGLAAGAALAALPVILHLFMKQTPKHVIFPALRLIRERQKRSRKRLRVKNWLLLLARMALLALMALALARPTLMSQQSGGDQEVPTALGLVFDTSLSMGYKEPALKDKTRLEEAKAYADDLLKKTHDGSEVFVVDSAAAGTSGALSPAAARKFVQGLVLRPDSLRSLNSAVGAAYAAVAASDRQRREVFILTDLAKSAWDTHHPVEGLDKVAKAKAAKQNIDTVLVRLSPKELHDVAIVEATPSSTVAIQGEKIEIKVKVRATGQDVKRVAEFTLDGATKGKEPIDIKAGGEAEVKFTTPKLDPAVPLHQGTIRITGPPDPLEFDDSRCFTFKVQPAVKVLVVSDVVAGERDDAIYIAGALDPDPSTLRAGEASTCTVDVMKTTDFSDRLRESLSEYACVFLNDVGDLPESDWGRLNAYVREGGGLVVALGNRCVPDSYNGPAASPLLPATVERNGKSTEHTKFGKVTDLTHPLFERYARRGIQEDLSQVPVYHYWRVKPAESARTLIAYADNNPALIERTFKGAKTGHVLLWTTPLSRRVDPKSPEAWNEFPVVPRFWAFLAILDRTVPYLAGITSEQLNYVAGQDAIVPVDPSRRFKNYVLEGGPEGKIVDTLSPPATSDSLVIPTPQTGQWRLTATGPKGEKATMGFSVNSPESETNLAPLEKQELEQLFGGKDGEAYHLASDLNRVNDTLIVLRVGQELFPWILMLILILITAENLLANRFHRESGQQQTQMAGGVRAPAVATASTPAPAAVASGA